MNAPTIKIDLEFTEESLETLREISALGAAAVRIVSPEPDDKILFLIERRLTMEQREEFERVASEGLGCKCLVVHDVSEIIHLQAPSRAEAA